MSVNSTSPATLFGGTWEKMSGGFLYGAVSSVGNGNGTGTATAGNNGNTGSTAITVEQMPSHNHKVSSGYGSGSGLKVDKLIFSQGLNDTKYYDAGTGGVKFIENIGGGKGHTHTLNNHTHNIPYMAVWIWKRTA